MADYIYVQTEKITAGVVDKSGYLINIALTSNFDFSAGVDTTDLSIVQTTDRSLLPISGLKKDYDFQFELIDEQENKCFEVDNIGNLTGAGCITTKDQLKFLVKNVITNSAVSRYFIYSEFLDEEIQGHVTVRGRVTGDEFFNKITFNASLKSGVNALALFALGI